jgi:transitional endoplasmic reticulum ATPase
MAASKNPKDQPDVKPPEEHVVDLAAKEHWKKGNALFEESKFDEAIKEYNEAISVDSKYADAYFNRALTERVTNDFEGAKRDLEIVLSLQPKSADAPLLIGDISETANDLVGAKYWYEKSLANNPDYTEAKNRLEHIDALVHMDTDLTGKQGTQQQVQVKKQEDKEVIEEGQIKKVSFFKSDVMFTDVIGLDKVKRYLQDNVVLAIKKPDLFKKYGKKLGVGLLLYGPPGVGKTHIVKAIAGEAGANVIIARINQIVDMYTGNTEKNLHAIFEQARKNTPCVIFFDELDALGVKRGGGDEGGGGNSSALRLAVNQFLVEMSGVESNPEGIFVIGATNNPWDIDPALKRSGRFGDSVYLKPPNQKDRSNLFQYYTRNKPAGPLDFGRLGRATMGYSPADIERIADKAAMLPLLHEYEHNMGREYTMKDVLSILKDKDYSGSSLDEWYAMVKKDVITKTETSTIDGKKQEVVKEGKLDPQEKILYKTMINDIKKNTSGWRIRIKKLIRWWALNLF